ncbi:MAG TPA: hypothetical protein VM327_02555 [Candidatus Thermoplasmatota archaeon]|nr:hypothetical protein [Candidatus Thermoplasmatota archaeon]
MEKAFWVGGPVPPAHLDSLALQRPLATTQALAALDAGRLAWLGGPPGCGQTTLLHQLARVLERPVLIVDLRSMPRNGQDDALAHVVQERPGPWGGVPEAWSGAIAAWDPGATLAFDGFDPAVHGWVRLVAAELGGAVLAAGPGGPIEPDPIADPVAAAFLERRGNRVRVSWTPAAAREAVGLAAGRPASLQALGATALHACLERGARRILVEDVLEAAVEAAHHAPFGAAGWRRLSGPRRALLLAMARDPGDTASAWARRCGLDPKAAVVHLSRLVKAGLVDRIGHGQYAMAPLLRLALRPSGGSVVRLVQPRGPLAVR